MKTLTVSHRMISLVVLYEMHTEFFRRAIAGINDEDAHNRLNTKANHVAWLTGSLVQQRFEIANQLGIEMKQCASELFENHKGIQDGVKYPALEEFRKDWDQVSPVSRELLENITDEKLDSEIDMGGEKMKLYEFMSFLMYREANCIGQIALWRRLLGYEPINYM